MWHNILRTTFPDVRVNNDLALSSEQWKILLKYQDQFKGINYQDELIWDRIKMHPIEKFFPTPWLNYGMIYLVTETVAEYPFPYFTEKTWRAIFNLRPFMLIAAQHSLKTLQKFGFQTFDQWWDESYDTLESAADRIQAVVSQIKILSKLNSKQQKEMIKNMQSTLTHNQKHLDIMFQQEIDRIDKML